MRDPTASTSSGGGSGMETTGVTYVPKSLCNITSHNYPNFLEYRMLYFH